MTDEERLEAWLAERHDPNWVPKRPRKWTQPKPAKLPPGHYARIAKQWAVDANTWRRYSPGHRAQRLEDAKHDAERRLGRYSPIFRS